MKTLVVARYQEDTSWYERIPSDWKLLEVQKGREIENTGREASSYLWAILHLYDHLATDDLVAFVQGDPFAHCQDIDLFLLLDRPTDGYRPLGDGSFVSNGDGKPHHPGLPVAERYTEWLGQPWPGSIRFAPGAQFVVNGGNILAHPKAFYQRLLVEAGDEWNPWVLERLWPAIFPPTIAVKNRATFYCQNTPVTTYLRCELPARYLPAKVSATPVVIQTEDDYSFPDHDGVAVMQFAGDKMRALLVHALQAKGVRVLTESDDNYFTVAPTMRRTGWEQRIGEGAHTLEGHAAILKHVDGCIVTTEFLAKQYRKHNPNVYIAPNCVDPIDWPVYRKRDDGVLRIGWFASNSHGNDAKLIHRALEWASRQPNVEVVTMGQTVSWQFRHKRIGWQDLPGYREALHELDIGLAPIVPTPWALCRSDLKAIEYAMAGAAVIASDVAPYSLLTDEQNCLKATDAAGFYKLVKRLVNDRDETKALAQAGREYVLAERTIQSQIGCWRDAIDDEALREAA